MATTLDDIDDEEAYMRALEAEEASERERWLAEASRSELVSEIRSLRARLAEMEAKQLKTLRPAFEMIDGVGNSKVDRFHDPLSVVPDLLKELAQCRRELSMNGQVENFLCDYRPDIVALLVACRRENMARVNYGWPEANQRKYLRNPLVGCFVGVRTGWFNFEQTRYWAAVVEAIPDGDFQVLERRGQAEVDLCGKQEQEGYEAGKHDIHECPYPRETLKAAMWWHGHRNGWYDYLDSLRSNKCAIALD